MDQCNNYWADVLKKGKVPLAAWWGLALQGACVSKGGLFLHLSLHNIGKSPSGSLELLSCTSAFSVAKLGRGRCYLTSFNGPGSRRCLFLGSFLWLLSRKEICLQINCTRILTAGRWRVPERKSGAAKYMFVCLEMLHKGEFVSILIPEVF